MQAANPAQIADLGDHPTWVMAYETVTPPVPYADPPTARRLARGFGSYLVVVELRVAAYAAAASDAEKSR